MGISNGGPIGDLHEGIDKGIEFMREPASDLAKGAALLGGKKSIISKAKKNLFEYPVFVSPSNPLDYVTATNSLLEQVYASYLQMAISIDPYISTDDIRAGEYFKKYKTDTNRYLECADTIYQQDACHAVFTEADYSLEFAMLNTEDNDARIFNEYLDYQPLSEFSHYFQEAKSSNEDYHSTTERNNYIDKIVRDDKGKVVYDADGEPKTTTTINTITDTRIPSEKEKEKIDAEIEKLEADAKLNRERLERLENEKKKDTDEYRKTQAELKQIEADAAKAEQELARIRDERDPKSGSDYLKKKKLSGEIVKLNNDIQQQKIDMRVKAPTMLDEGKIQKLNSLKPLMMSVNLRSIDNQNTISRDMEYIVGVKTFCRLIDPSIIPELIEFPVKEMNKLTRKAKWRAGELKFFKDIVFNIKNKKQSAIDANDPRRKWFRRLNELAHYGNDKFSKESAQSKGNPFAGFVKTIFKGKNASEAKTLMPNATIIFSQSDVDNAKQVTGVDLLKPSIAKRFCKELFLISLVIIDTDAQSIKMFIPDLHDQYDIHSIASVNKHLSLLDTSGTKTKEMFKLLG